MKSDIEIAQEAKLIRIDDLAHSAGLSDDEFEPYGRDKAKVCLHKDRKPHGKLILVTALPACLLVPAKPQHLSH